MAKRRSGDAEMPTDVEAAERWQEFCQRLDVLDRSVAELTELGQLILMALQEAIQAGVAAPTLLDLVHKVIEKAREAGAYYREGAPR